MSSALCLKQVSNEDDQDIAPQMKQMKLNSGSTSVDIDYIISNYAIADPLENLKTSFPTVSEKVERIFLWIIFLINLIFYT